MFQSHASRVGRLHMPEPEDAASSSLWCEAGGLKVRQVGTLQVCCTRLVYLRLHIAYSPGAEQRDSARHVLPSLSCSCRWDSQERFLHIYSDWPIVYRIQADVCTALVEGKPPPGVVEEELFQDMKRFALNNGATGDAGCKSHAVLAWNNGTWSLGKAFPRSRSILAREAAARRRIVKQVYRDPRTGFGSIANTLKAAKARNPFVSRDEVKQFFETLRDRQDRPQRGYNSFVPQEPMHEVQVDLAFMQNFGPKPRSELRAPTKVRTEASRVSLGELKSSITVQFARQHV